MTRKQKREVLEIVESYEEVLCADECEPEDPMGLWMALMEVLCDCGSEEETTG